MRAGGARGLAERASRAGAAGERRLAAAGERRAMAGGGQASGERRSAAGGERRPPDCTSPSLRLQVIHLPISLISLIY